MKLSGVLAVVLLITLGACGSNSPQAGHVPTSAEPATTPIAACIAPSKSGDLTASLMVDDLKRTYVLHVPPHLRSHQRYSLVIMFHGSSGDWRLIALGSGMSNVADKHGFLVAYPIGIGTWLSGGTDDVAITKNNPRLRGKGEADIHFIARLIDAVTSRVCIDRDRVYAGGMSSGGSMAYRLACELSPRIAAIAPVDGTYTYAPCHPSRPVSVIAFHGTANTDIPYHGGGPYHSPDVPTWARTWAHRDHCSRGPTTFLSQDTVRAVRYTGCRQGTEVQLYTMIGAGDEWPYLPTGDTAEVMWRFFATHPRS